MPELKTQETFRFRRPILALLAWQQGIWLPSLALFLLGLAVLISEGFSWLALFVITLPAGVVVLQFFSGRVRFKGSEIVAGGWFFRKRFKRSEIKSVYEGEIGWGRGGAMGLRVHLKSGPHEQFPLSGALGAKRRSEWLEAVQSWLQEEDNSLETR